MKSSYVFRDQVGIIGTWFSSWNECEQVVALYTLLRKVRKSQVKFLSQVLSQILVNSTENITDNEVEANDPAFISGLCKESKDEAVVRLLQCLPLLQPGNEQAKFEYLRIIPKIMSHSLENGCHLEESRQLLSYLLIHPAIKREEFADFTFWLNGLEESRKENSAHLQHTPVHRSSSNLSNYCTNDASRNQLMIQLANGYDVSYLKDFGANMLTGPKNSMNDGTFSSCSRDSGIFETDRNFRTLTSSNSVPLTGCSSYSMQPWNDSPLPPAGNFPDSSLLSPGQRHQKLSRTSSLAPGSMVPEWLSRHHEATAATNRLHLSVNPDNLHIPVSPQSSITSSGSGGSDSHLADRTAGDDASGMNVISTWLKSLRLHKYSGLFQQISYDEMMNMSEEWLAERDITKGARNKILISVKKLHERQDYLRSIEKEILNAPNASNVHQVIMELHQMMKTPIRSYSLVSKDDKTFEANRSDAPAQNSAESMVNMENTPSDSECVCEGDLPGQITRVLGKICTQLLIVKHPDVECLNSYLQLLDRCSNHPAFSTDNKKRLLPWRAQVHKFWQILMQKQAMERRRSGQSSSIMRGQHRLLRPQRSQPSWTFGNISRSPQSNAVPSVSVFLSNKTPYTSVPPGFPTRQPTLDVTAVKRPVSRAQSAPLRSGLLGLSVPMGNMNLNDSDPHVNLDPGMQHHALGEVLYQIDD